MRAALFLIVALLASLLTGAEAGTVNLAWDYVQGSDPAVGFNVYRQTSCSGVFIRLNSGLLPLTPLMFVDTTIPLAGGLFCWQVKAQDALGSESTPSNVLSFSVPQATPGPPSNLRGVVVP